MARRSGLDNQGKGAESFQRFTGMTPSARLVEALVAGVG